MDKKNTFQIGPALAIVIILGVVAIAGLYFYKLSFKDYLYDAGSTVVVPEGYFEVVEEEPVVSQEPEMSTSTDLESIEADLEASLDLDLSELDELDAELLNFEDLDSLDFDI